MDAETFARLDLATAAIEPPFAVVDLPALDANASDLVKQADGKPIRLASKSVRCRTLIRRVLDLPGFTGVLAFTLPEALWLAAVVDDVVAGYPTADAGAVRSLAADETLAGRVTLMVDSVEQLDFLAAAAGTAHPPLRVCLELDASLRLLRGRVHLGARRSPVHEPHQAGELARAIVARQGFRLVGVMAYEAQIAGVGDAPAGRPLRGLAVRGMQRVSGDELRARRAAAVAAVRAVADLEFVNGGGTGSVGRTASEPAVTEVAAGSGLYAPALFDGYRSLALRPAAFFVLPVVRRPAPWIATVSGGGWVASGVPGADRLPVPVWPSGLRLVGAEAAGEVQTPLRGTGADVLRVGDRVWFRHAKAGELCEHVNDLYLVDGDRVVDAVLTYRGEGMAFL